MGDLDAMYRTPVEALERELRYYKRRAVEEAKELEDLEKQRVDTIASLDDFLGEVEADHNRTLELIGDYRKAIKKLRGRVNAS